LAHELTHIARGREAKFVPPILRTVAARQSRAGGPGTIHDTTDEEALAGRVESEVGQAAVAQASANNVDESAAAAPATRPAIPAAFPPTPSEPSPDRATSEESWGGLPAPWDPLPDWVGAPQEAQPALAGPAVASVASSDSVSAPASSGASGAPAMAETDRSLPEAESPKPADAHEHREEAKQAAPDLDALARQVYSVIRRRLAADRRREFM
jgi:hypothetical protein